MSKITEKQIMDVAKLAKLSIDSKDLAKQVSEFNDILSHIEKLSEVKIEGTLSGDNATLAMFEDEPRPSNTIEDALKNAPSAEKPFFYIPRVIEGGKS
ncbi:MAG: Asp-tRNA(Asn)/Glu-tRNA(Gln) amidotransferase subunit GatC [Proteobacteria bacterium]|jgi:aspartyl-tRNA(Asn)/glutamyl-tRNA(Gln) amidotransferase subunit C|nr:Asp-tRNA(Asn)/Glu-tRNA(Gln) amidotransferase subunit GatC [Pseudomonadota bacterium]